MKIAVISLIIYMVYSNFDMSGDNRQFCNIVKIILFYFKTIDFHIYLVKGKNQLGSFFNIVGVDF